MNIGDKIGRLTVTGVSKKVPGTKQYKTLCVCDCGVQKEVKTSDLKTARIQSCGCLARDIATTHGLSGTVEYVSWRHMIKRCYDHNNEKYSRYGGRGISVCLRWRESVRAFVDDMGLKPTRHHQIERVDNDGNYEPSNCEWATRKQQSQNTNRNVNLTFEGVTMCMAEWSRQLGIPYDLIRRRKLRGWTDERTLSTPADCGRLGSRMLEWNGQRQSVGKWSVIVGIPPNVLSGRVWRGWSDERALTTPVG